MPTDENIVNTNLDELHKQTTRIKAKASKVPKGTHLKGNSLAPLWIILILVVLASVGGIVGIRRSRQRERATANLLLKKKQQATVSRKRINDSGKTLIAISDLAFKKHAEAKQHVLRVLGFPLIAGDFSHKPEPTNVNNPTAPPSSKEIFDEAKIGPVGDDGRAAPAGIVSRRELEQTRNRTAQRHRRASAQEIKANEPPIWKLGQKLLKDIEIIRENADIAERFIKLAKLDEQEVYREKRPEIAIKRIAEIKVKADKTKELINASQRSFERAKQTCASIAELRKEYDRQEELRLQREEEARKQREHRELVARETEEAIELAKETDLFIANFDPDHAFDVLNTSLEDFETENGKQIVSLSIEQCEKVVEMKSVLIDTLNTQPLRWGWKQSGAPRDILGADQIYLKVSGGQILWNKMTAAQLKYIVLQYIEGREEMTASQRSQVGLGAVILLTKKDAGKEAETVLQKLLDMNPALGRTASRLISK